MNTPRTVSDADIEAINESAEPGFDQLMEAYEPIEQSYFNAVQIDTPVVISSSTSSTER